MARDDVDGIKRFEDPLGSRRGPAPAGPAERPARGFGWVWVVALLVVLVALAGPAYVVATRGWDVLGQCRTQADRVDGHRQQVREYVSCVFTQ